jgi:hypothetical protein
MAPETAHPRGLLGTQRTDLWWVEPLLVFLVLSLFVLYSMFRILEGAALVGEQPVHPTENPFEIDNGVYHYLSPFGTPDLRGFVPGGLKDLAAGLPVVGAFALAMLTNPAFLILPIPAGFRFTCYYYRKAYYRSFVLRPAACGVEAVKGKRYRGEKRLMAVQNVHRYFLYLAILVTVFLAYDAVRGIVTPHGLYFGLGNVLMLANVALLCAYTFGCHSFRHLVGGNLDCYSCDAISQTRYPVWKAVTRLNQRHMLWAMASLFSVALTDIYIRWIGVTGATHILGVPV